MSSSFRDMALRESMSRSYYKSRTTWQAVAFAVAAYVRRQSCEYARESGIFLLNGEEKAKHRNSQKAKTIKEARGSKWKLINGDLRVAANAKMSYVSSASSAMGDAAAKCKMGMSS